MLARDVRPASRSGRFACCAVVLSLTGCLGSPGEARRPGDIDRQILRNTYVEEGGLVTLVVNTDATRRRLKSDYVPFGLVIANNGKRALTANRENLTLTDDQGRRYPLATVKEVRSLGSRTANDLRASEFFAAFFVQRLADRPRVRAVFFPVLGRGLVADRIELPREAWLIDVIYFPRPDGEPRGRTYELTFAPPELADPVFVRFRID